MVASEVASSSSATQPAFGDRTPWSAGAATMFAAITVVVAIGSAFLHAWLGKSLAVDQTSVAVDQTTNVSALLTMIVMQTVIIMMVWWGAARFGGNRLKVLSLESRLPAGPLLIGMVGMAALLIPFNLLIYTLSPAEFSANLLPFWEFARPPTVWLAALVFAVGAPLSEELLFRGFLLPALTKSRHGFRGAALLTTAGWTALHTYSLAGLVEVFMIGLFFCWLMHRYANLWVPIVLHALYNSVQLAVLAFWPT